MRNRTRSQGSIHSDSLMSAIVDPAFKAIPKNTTAFIIWRIENLQVVPVPKDQYGSFFEGDSYIVYACSEYGKSSGVDAKNVQLQGSPEVHIHFWLGAETSTDEAGVAAYKTVELDDYLGGGPIQHRETQGNESARFKGYFKNGLRILKGGCASGLNHVTDSFVPRLFRVKGKRSPTVVQQPSISWEYFNSGDVFILDTKEIVFVWIGKEANTMEKLQAAKVATKLRDEHQASSVVFVDDGREKALPNAEKAVFSALLDLGSRKVKTAEEAVSDEEIEETAKHSITLYHCTDEDGTYKVTEVKSGPLLQSDLKSEDSFIVDNGSAGIWVWVGRRASQKERMEAMRNAQGFVTKKGCPSKTPVTRVVDGAEPVEFKMLFASWRERNQTIGLGKINTSCDPLGVEVSDILQSAVLGGMPGTSTPNGPWSTSPENNFIIQDTGCESLIGKIATPTVNTKFDAATLHEKPQLAAESRLVDDGTSDRTVWRVENFELVEVPEKLHGLFFAGDCYVVQYSYSAGGRQKWIIYYWLGQHSSVDEQGTAALKTIELDDKLDGAAVQVRVVQGKEPPHFLSIFKGRLIILNGGKASSFDGDESKDTGIPESFLLQVRGNNSYNTRATQVDLRASSLNSNDVFVLKKGKQSYVWCGKGSTGDEREMAKKIASAFASDDYEVVYEGQEKSDFWEAVGGQEEYANHIRLVEQNEVMPARLFQCSNASGLFKGYVAYIISKFQLLGFLLTSSMSIDSSASTYQLAVKNLLMMYANTAYETRSVEEIMNFSQIDLVPEDVMMLDIYDTIFLWFGKGSNKEERDKAMSTAVEYLRSDPSQRDIDTPIVIIKQGYEPPTFTGFFGVWDTALWNDSQTYEQLRRELEGKNPVLELDPNLIDGDRSFEDFPKYSLSELTAPADELPEDVDKTHRELHLTQEDFVEVFKMDYSAFQQLPVWKQHNLKKAAKLY